ncbi:hypothetical protein TRFO_07017 [Tritrichomonas foetus]|uniref:Uncharacterized protein n=1 Tax=Tritrichomonas foetus TaxID=1144522 RepID=A0A1J4JZC8_9EUKA|nr:hypothetical protein TRFO_07017 [Tritrichomonas foetus]|eukprot:OHT02605.1 hypothetical protein TRFO_07017 [Tritrichomonas foetus]
MSLNIRVENGQTIITGPTYKIDEVKETIRQILKCESKYSLSTIRFHEKYSTISPEIQNALQFLYPKLHTDLLETAEKEIITENNTFRYYVGTYSNIIVGFLIEIFVKNQPAAFKCQINKNYDKSPVFTLNIPIPVQIKIINSSKDGLLDLYLSSESSIPFSTRSQLLKDAIHSISQKKIGVSKFSAVDIDGFEQDLQISMANFLKIHLLKSNDVFADDLDSKSFVLYILPRNEVSQGFSDLQYLEKVKNRVERSFFRIERRKCSGCGYIYSDTSNEPLKKFLKEDSFIPFPDGKMEHVDVDDDGYEVVMVNTEHGPVPLEEDGEIEVEICNHQGEPATSVSTWSFDLVCMTDI